MNMRLPARRKRRPLGYRQANQPDYERGRCVAVFGPPKSGVSKVIQILHEVSKTPTMVLAGATAAREEKVARIRKSALAPDVIFVDGLPSSLADVQALYDERLVHADGGAVIRIVADRASVLRRIELPRDQIEAFHESWALFDRALPEIEASIRAFGLPYFCVPNEEPDVAIGELARRSGIRT